MDCKRKIQSQTLWVNAVVGIFAAVMAGLEASLSVMKGEVPGYVYLGLVVTVNIYNFWRRTKTTEAVK